MSRQVQKRSNKRQAERAVLHRRREKEQRETERKRDSEPKPPADKPAKPQSAGDYLRSLGWEDTTHESLGETITIIGAPRLAQFGHGTPTRNPSG
jgi:hypothetical protein